MGQHRPHEKGVIVPRKGKHDPNLGADVVMAMVASDLAHLTSRIQAKRVHFSDAGLYGLYRTGAKAAVDIAIAGPFIGAPHAVMGMEKLIALGASRIWVLGWCGSLQPDLRIGNMIIPVWGIPEEGISRQYPLASGEATSDSGLCRILENQLKKKGVLFRKGGIWTTDAIYRETPLKIQQYGERGALGVDMEVTALMTVSAFRGVALAPLLVISDEIFDLRWRRGFSKPVFKTNCRLAGEVLIRAVTDVNNG